MMRPSEEIEVYLYRGIVDMRKSINGLSAIVEEELGLSPFAPKLFVFCNRGRDKIKILYWDVDGLSIWNKRLERGSFSKKFLQEQMDRRTFLMLLEGITPKKMARRFSA